MAQESFDPVTPETSVIKREIERTRVEMSATIGEIQDRLRPEHLLQQAKDSVTETAAGKARSIMNSAGEKAAAAADRARGVGDQVAGYAKDHPIHLAVTIGVLTWWMLRGRNRADDWYGATDTSWQAETDASYPYDDGQSLRAKVGGMASSARDTVGQYASSAKETVGQYASSARESAGEYAESARDAARRASERARHAAERARSAASTATLSADDFVRENPLAAAAVALAVGAAIGMSIPRTEIEDRAMGETRDQAWEKASRVARNLTDNVAERVQSAAESVVGESLAASRAGSTEPNMGRA